MTHRNGGGEGVVRGRAASSHRRSQKPNSHRATPARFPARPQVPAGPRVPRLSRPARRSPLPPWSRPRQSRNQNQRPSPNRKPGAIIVTRAKNYLQFTRQNSKPVDRSTGLRSDHVGKPTLPISGKAYPVRLCRVGYYDSETGSALILLTNY